MTELPKTYNPGEITDTVYVLKPSDKWLADEGLIYSGIRGIVKGAQHFHRIIIDVDGITVLRNSVRSSRQQQKIMQKVRSHRPRTHTHRPSTVEFAAWQKREILGQQHSRCNECGRHIDPNAPRFTPWKATFHHKDWVSKGGEPDLDNGEALCLHCHHWHRHKKNHSSWCRECRRIKN
jgi:hypothetical protein